MNCADLEISICDYVDGALSEAERAEVARHLAQCPGCAELARDSAAAVAFLERAEGVEPPPELITRILFDAPWSKGKARPARWRDWLAAALSPIRQPKFAMGMAMTILSLSMLFRFVSPAPLSAKDWRPAAIRDSIRNQAQYAWTRGVKFYENLKIVYQIQTTLRQWQQQDEEQHPTADNNVDGRKLPVRTPGQNEPGRASPSDSTGETP
ncbi:MAG: zf-HC2 domain-containing protein [Bryobacteraceae bacterium]|jgi:hypothetical protein